MSALLAAEGLAHTFGPRRVLDGVSLSIGQGELTAIIGPNGAGKSTCLRILGRMLRPNRGGSFYFDGEDAWAMSPREFARRVAFVPQAPLAPADTVVEELVYRGRYPHRGLFGRLASDDREAVERALEQAGVSALRGRTLGTLSGGERQRVWVALALAQEPDVLLLDEPTTFLDIGHQLDLLLLLADLNRARGLTVLMVMHDVGLAAQVAGRLVAMRDGRVVADGPPDEVVTVEQMERIFGVRLRVYHDPETGAPGILPSAGSFVGRT